jgi:hypothetical protein
VNRRRCAGQASVEVLALVPIIVATVVVVWQLAVLGIAALEAHAQVRQRAVSGTTSGSGRVSADVTAPSLLPGRERVRLRAVAEVYAP